MAFRLKSLPTYRLTSLRRKLRPVYGIHTDAVISLIGNRMHPAVLSAALRGDLLEAHALQKVRSIFIDAVLSKNASAKTYLGWDDQANLPRWMTQKFVPRPARRPRLSFVIRPDWQNSEELHAHGADASALPFFSIGFVSYPAASGLGVRLSPALYVNNLQRSTGGRRGQELMDAHEGLIRAPNASEKRQAEGAAHVALDELEALARRRKKKLVVVTIGQIPAEANLSPQPIHVELLHDYGRLLQQHGYRLMELPSHVRGIPWFLAWVKALRVPGAPDARGLERALSIPARKSSR